MLRKVNYSGKFLYSKEIKPVSKSNKEKIEKHVRHNRPPMISNSKAIFESMVVNETYESIDVEATETAILSPLQLALSIPSGAPGAPIGREELNDLDFVQCN
jgi:hypothetical protein